MATINFYLDKADRKGRRPIMITYMLNSKKVRFYTGEKTTDKDWNSDEQKVKKNGEGASELNARLNDFSAAIWKAEREAKLDGLPLSTEYVKSKLLEITGKSKGINTVYEAFEDYISTSSKTKTPNTIKGYRSCLTKLKEFEKAMRFTVSFEKFDSTFYEKFVSFMMDGQALMNNSIGKNIKVFKSFMTYATDKGYNKKLDYSRFKVLKEDADVIYLTEPELLKLHHLENLPGRLKLVRDVFCLGCFTGLRFSDLSGLKQIHIKHSFIELKTQKTRDFLRIPLNDYAIEILNRYSHEPPRQISNQKMNAYLKELGKLAEIDEPILLTKYRGVMKIETSEPKYNFISSHTARRTFVTLSLEKGMRPEVVMSITGHKDYSTFKKYIKLTETVKAVEMKKIWNKTLKAV